MRSHAKASSAGIALGKGIALMCIVAAACLALASIARAGTVPGGSPTAVIGPAGAGACTNQALATGLGDLTTGSATVENVSTACGTFENGRLIEATGIPAGTKIVGTGPGTLTLSANATATATAAQLSASSFFEGSVWLALNEQSHRLYALDASLSGTKKIYAFNSPSLTGSIAGFPLPVPPHTAYYAGIAVDNTTSPSGSAGRIYFSNPQSLKVHAYSPLGVELTSPSFPNFPITQPPGNLGPTLCGVGTDSSGNIYVGREEAGGSGGVNRGRLDKYAPDGSFIETVINAVNAEQYGTEQPCDTAVDTNGDIFVAESDSGAIGSGGVWKYTAASGYAHDAAVQIVSVGSFVERVSAIALDSSRGLLYAARRDSNSEFSGGVSIYDTDTGANIGTFATGLEREMRGITIDEANSKVYVAGRTETSSYQASRIYAFGFVPTPDITNGFAGGIAANSVTLNATVDPNGVQLSSCRFQYTTSSDYELHGFTNAQSTPCANDPGAGNKVVGVAANVGGLNAATEYRFRFVAANANGASTGDAVAFATRGPLIRRTSPEGVTDTSATLTAEVNPNGEGTGYRFQYVDSANFEQSGYEHAVTSPAAAIGIGSGNAYQLVSRGVAGLTPDTGFHYRVIASNNSAAATGPDTTFATHRVSQPSCPNPEFHTGVAAALPDCRAFEQVSPVFKNGYDLARDGVFYSTPDGERITFDSNLGAFADSSSSPRYNAYAALRGATDWATVGITPPIEPMPSVLFNVTGTVIGVSPDLSKQLVATNASLTPDAVDRWTSLYIHDSDDDSYRLVVSTPSASGVFFSGFVALSNDGKHAYFQAQDNETSVGLLPSTPPPAPGETAYTYEFDDGELRPVGILPNGSVSSGRPTAAYPFTGYHDQQFYSQSMPWSQPVPADSKRIYWQETKGSPFEAGGNSPIYLQESGQSILVSKRSSDGSAQNARFWKATPDGLAFMTSANRLTSDASAAGEDLYLYDPNADELINLTPSDEPAGARVKNILGISQDGSYVYFVAQGALAGDALAGMDNIYVWHDDRLRLITTLASAEKQIAQSGKEPSDFSARTYWRVSSNGRYLGFLFGGRLIGRQPQPPHPFKVAYLYDYKGDSLACASCPPGGDEPSGEPALQHLGEATTMRTGQLGSSRNVSNAGQFFFDTADSLVDGDANGKRDVYEYSQGEIHLISSGQGDTDSYVVQASVSGNDVFFLTRDRLVGRDIDPNYDLYDARVNGGLAAQRAAAQGSSCQGDACQGAFTAPLAGAGAGTGAFSGAADPKPKRTAGKKRRKPRKHAKRHAGKQKARHAKNDRRANR